MSALCREVLSPLLKIYMAGVIYFGANCALASISAFLPTIIKTFGFSECTTCRLWTSAHSSNSECSCSTTHGAAIRRMCCRTVPDVLRK